jgi:hypothetical protein
MFLQHLVYAALIDAIGRGDIMLEFSSPISKPNIHSIIKGQSIGSFHSEFLCKQNLRSLLTNSTAHSR